MSGWRALDVIVRRELIGRRRGTTLILIAVFTLAAAALVAGFESQSRAADQWDAAFDDANGAHVTVVGDDESTLREIAARPEVAQATHLYRRLGERPLATSTGRGGDVALREVAAGDLPEVARPLLRDGRWVAAGAAGEIVVERSFALEEHVRVGDTVTIDPGGVGAQFEVVGIALDLIDCFHPQCDPMPAWLDPAGFARIERGDASSEVFLRLEDPATTDAFVSDLLGHYPEIGVADWLDTRADALAVSDFFGAFLSGFGIFVMIAAAVVVAGLMTTRVITRRRDIGLMKSVGFTPAQVTITMLATHVTIGAIAVVFGWLLGSWLSGPMQLRISEVLGDRGAAFTPGRMIPTLIIVEVIVLVATLLPSWRTGRLATTAALAAVPPRRGRASRIQRALSTAGGGPVARVSVAAAVARPARAFFTALALVLAAVAVVVTVGMNRSVDRVLDDVAWAGDPYDLAINRTSASPNDVIEAIENTPGVETWFTATDRLAAVGDSGAFLARALGGDVAHAGYIVRRGRTIQGPGEAIVGYGLLGRLGVDVGDEITAEINRRPVQLRIVGWYSETEDSGEVLQFPFETLLTVAPDSDPGSFLVRVANDASATQVAAGLQQQLGDRALVRSNTGQEPSEVDAFQTAFLLVTLLVLAVAFTNLVSTTLLATRERFHDLGVLRSIGFTPRQVVLVTSGASALIGGIATLVGIPIGLLFLRQLLDVIGEETGMGPGFGLDPSAVLLVAIVPLGALLAGGLGALVARRPATTTVSELVRFE